MSFTKHEKNGVVFHTADAFTAAGCVRHGFASRWGGVSTGALASLNLSFSRGDDPEAVRENYHRLCAALGTEESRLVLTHQVHSDDVRVATAADILPDLTAPIPYETDGLITNEPGLCLTIYYADCIPVLLCDPVKRAIGAVHSGWRGTAQDIVPKAIAKMQKLYGCDPKDILAAIGPGIGPCCFETHDDVPTALQAALGPDVTPYTRPLPDAPGKYAVDLKGILTCRLQQSGLTPSHIDTLPLCTGCHPELYWSHRKLGGQRGNHGAMIALGGGGLLGDS